MTKTDFLASLRSHLNGRIDPYEVQSNLDYYTAYIESELVKGRTEEDILNELGEPSLIARTLIDSVKRREGEEDDDEYSYSYDYTKDPQGTGSASGAYTYSQNSYSGQSYGAGRDSFSDNGYQKNESYTGQTYTEKKSEAKRSTSRLWMPLVVIGVIILLLLILFVVLCVFVFRIGWALLKFIWPVILILIIIGVVARITRSR